jgi:trimeric autotransporter adhesin
MTTPKQPLFLDLRLKFLEWKTERLDALATGPQGPKGDKGDKGDPPDSEFDADGTRVRFEQGNGSWGPWSADLRGPQGSVTVLHAGGGGSPGAQGPQGFQGPPGSGTGSGSSAQAAAMGWFFSTC